MNRPADVRANLPASLENACGLSIQCNANGSVRRIACGDITFNLFPGDEVEGGLANIYLRRRGATTACVPLLGPSSPSVIGCDGRQLTATGEWQGIRYRLTLVLAETATAWFWHLGLQNVGPRSALIDLVHVQDTALAHYGAIRLNEYYVSQYVDHTPLTHPDQGALLAVRQNLPMSGRQPWALIGSLGEGVGFATDALQLYGRAHRAGALPIGLTSPALPSVRHQHEHSLAAIQDRPIFLVPGAQAKSGFFIWFEADHPEASSDADLVFVERALALPEAAVPSLSGNPVTGRTVPTRFSTPKPLPTLDLTTAELDEFFGEERRAPEEEAGNLLSFFTGANGHVVLKAKELQVLRPHGHLLRTGQHLTPDESSLTSTLWMKGVFNSLLTQGHVSINRLLSTTRSYLNLFLSGGQRIFVEQRGSFHLLETPSAFEITPEGARWLYKHPAGLIEITCTAGAEDPVLSLSIDVLAGAACRFLISHRVALNGDDGADPVPVRYRRDGDGVILEAIPESDVGRRFPDGFFRFDAGPGTHVEQIGGDELLFADGETRHQPFLVVITGPTASADFHLSGHLVAPQSGMGAGFARGVDGQSLDETAPLLIARIRPGAGSSDRHAAGILCLEEILPWFAHNAMVHYLAPRGLEQFSGGGWGTRDISQGPVELLLGFGLTAPVRDLLCRVFRAQNPDGDWPQWFTFFDRDRGIRAGDSHGDIVFWPLLALAQYLVAAADASILDQELAYFHPDGDESAERATVWGHVERALAVIDDRVIPGTALAAYGHGDWNDSLQPADPSMRERLCSAWTVTLHHQMLATLAQGLRAVGREALAAPIESRLPRILADFQQHLLPDGVLTGFAYFPETGPTRYLVHPRDAQTGMHYGLLAMIHALANDLFSPDQARAHIALIQAHLLAPDGARLFDRPPPYHGGPQTYFQRAESSSFFGREIGVMYMHAHLRYAEAMARHGDAEAFFDALCRANPIAIRTLVPHAALRQANCYYSSSDAAFFDRYEAAARYGEVNAGTVSLEGGWRVYSSGAGIATRLIHQRLLGFEIREAALLLDPVLPCALDGLEVEIVLWERPVTVVYRLGETGSGPKEIVLNGTPLVFSREPNPYRMGGALLGRAQFAEHFDICDNRLEVQLA